MKIILMYIRISELKWDGNFKDLLLELKNTCFGVLLFYFLKI